MTADRTSGDDVMGVPEHTLICPRCPQARRTQFSAPGKSMDLCDVHGWVEGVEMIPAGGVVSDGPKREDYPTDLRGRCDYLEARNAYLERGVVRLRAEAVKLLIAAGVTPHVAEEAMDDVARPVSGGLDEERNDD